jgi:hypothetical protein
MSEDGLDGSAPNRNLSRSGIRRSVVGNVAVVVLMLIISAMTGDYSAGPFVILLAPAILIFRDYVSWYRHGRAREGITSVKIGLGGARYRRYA